MPEHPHRHIDRHADVAIVGGSAAGLAAALQLARQRRSVIVIDDGTPRNAPSPQLHGFPGFDGSTPSSFTASARADVRRYGAEILTGRAISTSREVDGRFRVELSGGTAVIARRLLVATGLVDVLPDIDGLAPRWGTDVVHCPFCHGYEVRDRRIVQIVTHDAALHAAALFRQLSPELTVVVHEGLSDGDPRLDVLRSSGVAVVDRPAARVVTDADGRIVAVELVDGEHIATEVVAVGPRFSARVEPFAGLGLHTVAHPSGLGDIVHTDARGATTIAGVYAAGNATDPSLQVLHAAAHGSQVGAMIAIDLAEADLGRATRRSGHEVDWDHRYGDERIWSGNPNGALVVEVGDLVPGRALDVGAGEGGDALWLSEQGWHVTAGDISPRALDRVRAEAVRRGLRVDCLQADANALDPFRGETYDLVVAFYASIPRSPDARAVRNLVAAVAPGGTLLVVNHDPEPMRVEVDPQRHSRAFDPDAFVSIEDVADAIASTGEWTIDVHERRPRPPGAASGHHVDDVVLRARRSAA
jgi:thioredoxin reductase/SAM-dependent methyltransferase